MDERIFQLKELKKQYKRLTLRAGLGWKITAWLFFCLFLVVGGITLFVLGNSLSVIQSFNQAVWQPVKAMLGTALPYEAVWNLAKSYGIFATAAAAVVWLLSWIFAAVCKANVKHTEAYLNYRTMKLTLETEKEER